MVAIIIWLLLVCSLVGLWGLLYPLIAPNISQQSKRLKLFSRLTKLTKRKNMKWLSGIDKMLYLVSKKYVQGLTVYRFFGLSVMVFSATFITLFFFTSELTFKLTTTNPFGNTDDLGSMHIGMAFSLFLSCLAGSIPFIALWVRYQRQKIKAGYDLLDMLKVMSRYTHLSLDTMLSLTAEDLPDDSTLKRPTKLLSFSFSTFSHDDELQQEINRFVNAVQTTFAMSFATQLVQLFRTGGDVALFIDTLIDSMESQLVQVNKVKEEFSDAIALGSWINLFALVFICGGVASFIGRSNYVRLQFQTMQGVTFLGIILVTIFISMVAALVLSKPKLDYR